MHIRRFNYQYFSSQTEVPLLDGEARQLSQYIASHSLQPIQTGCRYLHSRRSRTLRTDLTNSRTSNAERNRSTNLPPLPTTSTDLYA